MMKSFVKIIFAGFTLIFSGIQAQTIDNNTFTDINDKVIEWRRYFHQNPELGNREFETAAYIAKHLRKLGLEVETELELRVL